MLREVDIIKHDWINLQNRPIEHVNSTAASSRHFSLNQHIYSAHTAPHMAGAVENDRSRHRLNSANLHT